MGLTSSPRTREQQALQLTKSLPIGFSIHTGTAGDHPAIFRFLKQARSCTSETEFHAQNERPNYEPFDRLLVKRGPTIVAHAHLVWREIRFASTILPVAQICEWLTLPEFSGQGLEAALLQLVEQQARADGAVLAMMASTTADFSGRHGWVPSADRQCLVASPQRILSLLSASRPPRQHLQPASSPLHVRYWRHVEREALPRLYNECTSGACGAVVRDEAYWRWLLTRCAYDQILVAVEDSPRLQMDDSLEKIVGYAAICGSQIVELVASGNRSDAARVLIARVCGDAIEENLHEVCLGEPRACLLGDEIARWKLDRSLPDAEIAQSALLRPINLPRLLELIHPVLLVRLHAQEISAPFELAIQLEGRRQILQISEDRAALIEGRWRRSYLECSEAVLLALLLGIADVSAEFDRQTLRASTTIAAENAQRLFPTLPWWYPHLDDLSI